MIDLEGWAGLALTRPQSGVLLVTIDRPERLNTLSAGMKRDLIELCSQVAADDETRVVVLTGAGRAFCAGDFVSPEYRTEPAGKVPSIPGGHTDAESTYVALRSFSQALNQRWRELDKPTIAAVNGPAVQSGLSLALCCDIRFASSTSRLSSGTLRLGLMPDEGGHFLLLQHLGLAGTLDFLLRSRVVDAAEALRLGLVNEIVAPDDLLARSLALAEELAHGPQLAMRMLKRSIYRAAEATFDVALDDIAVRTAITDHHPDAREGAVAFLEKRRPQFAGAPRETGSTG